MEKEYRLITLKYCNRCFVVAYAVITQGIKVLVRENRQRVRLMRSTSSLFGFYKNQMISRDRRSFKKIISPLLFDYDYVM